MRARTSYGLSFLVFAMLSVALMIIDARSALLNPVRDSLYFINQSVEFIVAIPNNIARGLNRFYPDNSLYDRYEILRQQYATQQLQLQRLQTLQKENRRLKELLAVSEGAQEEVFLSQVKHFDLENYAHRVVLKDGRNAGIVPGQVVFEPNGVIGQVSDLGDDYAVITLISDAGHLLPVEVQRNGLRTIARGSGRLNQLELPYIERSADIRQGDVLVTSGIGGRFPYGYKVAQVEEVIVDSNRAFLDVRARPFFEVKDLRDVLLIRPKEILPPLKGARRTEPLARSNDIKRYLQ